MSSGEGIALTSPLRRALSLGRGAAGRWAAIARLLPYAGPRVVAAAVLLNVAAGLLPLAFVWWMGVLFASLPTAIAGRPSAPADVAGAFGLAIVAFMLQQFLAPFQSAVGELVTRRVDGHALNRLASAALSAPMPLLESTRAENLLSDARGAFDRVLPTAGAAAAGLLALIHRYVHLCGAVVLIGAVLGPAAAAIAAVTALIIRYGQRGSLTRFSALWLGLAPDRRRMIYIRRLVSGADAAKEIRVLGLIGWFLAKHRHDTRRYLEPLWRGRRRILFWPFIGFSLVGLVGGGLLLTRLATASLGLLELAVALQAVLIPLRFGGHFPESDTHTQYGLQADTSIREFERLAGAGRRASGGTELGPPQKAIRFENVMFRYDKGGPPVLDGLELEIEAGRSTAIVGLNGAGKTTIVKLLTRLYDPDSGRVTIDGADLRQADPRGWQRHIAVIFQDFVRYELSAAENIAMGAAHAGVNPAALAVAIERARVHEFVQGLSAGADTVLSGRYDGGRDLSGGQWQRIALARAVYAVETGARVLVMDEPTAQLDVRAEVEFFDRFLDLTRGLTSVVISHRFSSVRRADRIVVLADGRVVERGSHQELVEAGGRYAELFRLQARRFGEAVR